MKAATAKALAKAEQDVDQTRGQLIGTASVEESSDLEVELAGDRYLAALAARDDVLEAAKLEPQTEEPPPPEEQEEEPPPPEGEESGGEVPPPPDPPAEEPGPEEPPPEEPPPGEGE